MAIPAQTYQIAKIIAFFAPFAAKFGSWYQVMYIKIITKIAATLTNIVVCAVQVMII
jgi:hypothetical protein